MTNELFLIGLPGSKKPNKVVLRFYGKASHDIPLQIKIVELLAAQDFGPKLYGTFEDGRLEEYLPSAPLTTAQIRHPDIYKAVATKIARLQNIDVPFLPKNPNWLSEELEKMCKTVRSVKNVESVLSIPQSTLNAIDMVTSCVDFDAEVTFIKTLIARIDPILVFTNNDLHQNNVLFINESEGKPDLESRIVLIDFEYGSYNHRAFEIANHLAEWRIDYHYPEYPFLLGKDDMFPTESQKRDFIKHYLRQWKLTKGINGISNGDCYINDKEVDKLMAEVDIFIMASDLLWGMWAFKMGLHNPDKLFYWVSILKTKL